MRHSLQIAICLSAALLFGVSPCYSQRPRPQQPAPPRSKVDNVVGEIWEYWGRRIVDDKLKSERIEGRFRVNKYEVFRGAKKVGFIKPSGPTDSTMTITDWPDMNGKVVLTMTRKGNQTNATTWQGLLKKDDGSTWKLSIVSFER